jgi:sugar phosphate isomerase/epimerase
VDRPFSDGYEALRPFIEYVHVKDAMAGSGQVVPAGKGNGELNDTLSALRDSGFDSYFSLEPHLAEAGIYSGFSGADLFKKASGAFKDLLLKKEIEWR